MPDPTRWPGRKIEPAPDPTASRVGSGSGRVGPGLCKMSGSFGFFGFRVKIFSPCPARQSYRVKNFDPSPPIKLFGSGRVGLFSGGLGRVRRVGQPMPRSIRFPSLSLHPGPTLPTSASGPHLTTTRLSTWAAAAAPLDQRRLRLHVPGNLPRFPPRLLGIAALRPRTAARARAALRSPVPTSGPVAPTLSQFPTPRVA